MSLVRRHLILFVLCFGLLAAPAVAAASGTDESGGASPAGDEPAVVRAHNQGPKDTVTRKHFQPWAKPSPSQVKQIIRLEQNRWGGPAITNRVACESEFRWNATNGQYRGLLQVGSWWNYAWPKTPRKVVLRDSETVRKPVRRIRHFSDGSVTREIVRFKKVKRTTLKIGKLPKSADPYHGWAAIRVGQRAVSGDGPSTAWSCGV